MTLTIQQIRFRNDTALVAALIVQIILCCMMLYQIVRLNMDLRTAAPAAGNTGDTYNAIIFLVVIAIIISLFLLYCRFKEIKKDTMPFIQTCNSLFGVTKRSIIFILSLCAFNVLIVYAASSIHTDVKGRGSLGDFLAPSSSNLYTLSVLTLVASLIFTFYKLYGIHEYNMYAQRNKLKETPRTTGERIGGAVADFAGKAGSALWTGAGYAGTALKELAVENSDEIIGGAKIVGKGLWEGTKALGRGTSYLGGLAYDYYKNPPKKVYNSYSAPFKELPPPGLG